MKNWKNSNNLLKMLTKNVNIMKINKRLRNYFRKTHIQCGLST